MPHSFCWDLDGSFSATRESIAPSPDLPGIGGSFAMTPRQPRLLHLPHHLLKDCSHCLLVGRTGQCGSEGLHNVAYLRETVAAARDATLLRRNRNQPAYQIV